MTPAALNGYTLKDLAQLAKKRGVSGWHSMRKDELVRALLLSAKPKSAGKNGRKMTSPVRRSTGKRIAVRHKSGHPTPAVISRKNPRLVQRLEQAKARLMRSKSLATESNGQKNGVHKDRLIVMVRGPYWLHAYWELTPTTIQRVEAAMGQLWHAAKPVLRLYRVSTGGSSNSADTVLRDIPIHGGVRNWYVDVQDPPQGYRLSVGYLAENGRYFPLCRSNVVNTPAPGSDDGLDGHWDDVAEQCDKIYAMSGGYSLENSSTELQEVLEERLRRPLGPSVGARFGAGADGIGRRERSFDFEIDAELIVYGATRPDAHVTLQGEPVRLRPDGSFTVRCDLPNRRQVLPIVACSQDGVEQRTIVMAVERNTKAMEPVIRDSGE